MAQWLPLGGRPVRAPVTGVTVTTYRSGFDLGSRKGAQSSPEAAGRGFHPRKLAERGEKERFGREQ